MSKMKRKYYGAWHVQTGGYYSLHNDRACGYWLSLEAIKNWADASDWINHVAGKRFDSHDVNGLRMALTDIFGALSEPYSKQAIRARMKSILAVREAA
jgi:hypothetical protein